MNVLLINPNREIYPYPVLPLGLCYVASALEGAGFDVQFLDLAFSSNLFNDVKKTIKSFKPDAIGLSIRNIDNGEYLSTVHYLPQIKEIIRLCREESGAVIFIGGSAVNIAPALLLEYMEADYSIAGDGERTAPELLRRIDKGLPLSDLPGLAYKIDEAVRFNPPGRDEDYGFEILSRPYRWVPVKKYIARGGIVPVQTKRGCPFNCIYCSYNRIEGSVFRTKPVPLVLREIEDIMSRTGIKTFEFVDSVFNLPAPYTLKLLEAITGRNLNANFGAADFNPYGSSKELFDLMARAGFRSLICTPESGSQKMLESLQKGFGKSELVRTARFVRSYNIPALWVFLIGAPGETMETVEETLEFISEYAGRRDMAYLTVGVRVYPGTPLADIARKEGVYKEEKELLQPVFYFSPRLEMGKLKERLAGFSRKNSNFIYSVEARDRMLPILYRLFHCLRLPHPYWKHAVALKKFFK